MMRKLMLLGAGAIGYVLGAKAGRERYEQIMEQAQKIRHNPTVQRSVEDAKSAAQDAAGKATEKVRAKTGESGDTGTGTGTTMGGTTGTGTGPGGPAGTGTVAGDFGTPSAPEGFGVGDEGPVTPPPRS